MEIFSVMNVYHVLMVLVKLLYTFVHTFQVIHLKIAKLCCINNTSVKLIKKK